MGVLNLHPQREVPKGKYPLRASLYLPIRVTSSLLVIIREGAQSLHSLSGTLSAVTGRKMETARIKERPASNISGEPDIQDSHQPVASRPSIGSETTKDNPHSEKVKSPSKAVSTRPVLPQRPLVLGKRGLNLVLR